MSEELISVLAIIMVFVIVLLFVVFGAMKVASINDRYEEHRIKNNDRYEKGGENKDGREED